MHHTVLCAQTAGGNAIQPGVFQQQSVFGLIQNVAFASAVGLGYLYAQSFGKLLQLGEMLHNGGIALGIDTFGVCGFIKPIQREVHRIGTDLFG